jgi:hypothetical protein
MRYWWDALASLQLTVAYTTAVTIADPPMGHTPYPVLKAALMTLAIWSALVFLRKRP